MLFKNEKNFAKIVSDYSENMILALDVWGEKIKISGWREDSYENIFSFIPKVREKYALNSFLITQIKSDGLMRGPDH